MVQNKVNALAALFMLFCFSGLAAAEPIFEITVVGLTGTPYTRSDGYQSNKAVSLNNLGQVIGYAERYDGASNIGVTAWLYDGDATSEVGLTGTGYTRSDGYQYNFAKYLNDSGQVIGDAERWSGTEYIGVAAWLYNGATASEIGLTDAQHTSSDGLRRNISTGLNTLGQVIGHADRYDGTTNIGRAAWVYDGTVTSEIGLTGTPYTRSDGYKHNEAVSLNNLGQVIGYTERYGGSANLGVTAWLYDNAATGEIGLTGTGYTRSDGYQYNFAKHLNDSGQVIGDAERWSGTEYLGVAAWLYDGATASEIGLTDAQHTSSDGLRRNISTGLNTLGQVIGHADRYDGTNNIGMAAWVYDGAVTSEIGLTGTPYTRSDGYKHNEAVSLNNLGQVIGYTERYDGSANLGVTAWLYDDAATGEIGLTGTGYTRSDGYQYNFAKHLNDSGQVIGDAERWSGAEYLGVAAWFYDLDSDMIFDLTFSTRSSDGFALSTANFLSDDGIVLGTYSLYDTDMFLGTHIFWWNMDDGLFDLGEMVAGGLDTNGWESLYSSLTINTSGQIAGNGELLNGNRMAYLLTPQKTKAPIPEPNTMLLFCTGLVGLAAIGRRKSK